MVFQGRLPTAEYLYRLRLGLDSPCILCGLHSESNEHLYNLCLKTQYIWRNLGLKLNTALNFTDGFYSSSWLLYSSNTKYILAIIFAGAWLIWKARCDAIFKNSQPNYNSIISKSIDHANEFALQSSNFSGKKLVLNNFSNVAGNIMFLYINRCHHGQVCSVGLFLTNTNYSIILAGCAPFPTNAILTNELTALTIAFQAIVDQQMNIQHILIVNTAL